MGRLTASAARGGCFWPVIKDNPASSRSRAPSARPNLRKCRRSNPHGAAPPICAPALRRGAAGAISHIPAFRKRRGQTGRAQHRNASLRRRRRRGALLSRPHPRRAARPAGRTGSAGNRQFGRSRRRGRRDHRRGGRGLHHPRRGAVRVADARRLPARPRRGRRRKRGPTGRPKWKTPGKSWPYG